MKKKNLLNSALICFMLSLTSCNELTVYEKLAQCSTSSYDKVELNVLTKTNGQDLKSKFVLNKTEFNYEIERLSLLDLNGTNDSYLKTIKGNGTYINGKITLNDKEVEIPTIDEIKGSLSFNSDNFTNVVEGEGTFKADVNNLSDLLNATINGHNGKIKIEYTNEPYKFKSIEIKYDTTLSNVLMSYEF